MKMQDLTNFMKDANSPKPGDLCKYMSRTVLVIRSINDYWFECLECDADGSEIKKIATTALKVINDEKR